jgi:hypothetical protein
VFYPESADLEQGVKDRDFFLSEIDAKLLFPGCGLSRIETKNLKCEKHFILKSLEIRNS